MMSLILVKFPEQTKDINDLAKYPAIGWDFDGTLINCANAPLFWSFIKANPQIKHVIVTFRTHGLEDRVFDVLEAMGGPVAHHFDGLASIPYELWERNNHCIKRRGYADLGGPPTSDEIEYQMWKGMKCAELGLPVLIDDMGVDVEDGCKYHGVEWFDPMIFKRN